MIWHMMQMLQQTCNHEEEFARSGCTVDGGLFRAHGSISCNSIGGSCQATAAGCWESRHCIKDAMQCGPSGGTSRITLVSQDFRIKQLITSSQRRGKGVHSVQSCRLTSINC